MNGIVGVGPERLAVTLPAQIHAGPESVEGVPDIALTRIVQRSVLVIFAATAAMPESLASVH